MIGINSNYSQFYKGSEHINNSGSAPGKKDTIVRYEFNTTDEKGNKIMDKMSKEETFRAMKDISSQYGDNVIVEFSGDGLAALEEHKGKMALPEPPVREVPEGMFIQLEGPKPLTEEELEKMNERHGDDEELVMRLADSEAYKEYQKICTEGRAKGTQEGMTEGFRYLVKWYNQMAQTDHDRLVNAVDRSHEEKKVLDYYSGLQKKFNYLKNGNIAVSDKYLKQCVGDSKKAKELEDFLSKLPDLEKQGYEQLSAQNAAKGGRVTYYQQSWIINDDGSVQSTVYSVTETEMTNAERMKKNMDERLEKQKERKEEEEKIKERKEERAEQKEKTEDTEKSDILTVQGMPEIRIKYVEAETEDAVNSLLQKDKEENTGFYQSWINDRRR